MDGDVQGLLTLLAEVSIGSVALSGITMVLIVSTSDRLRIDPGQISAQLSMAFAVVLFSILPMVVDRFALSEPTLWVLCSALYLGVILFFQFIRLRRGTFFPDTEGMTSPIVLFPALSGIVLLTANFWVASDYLYTTQLYLALSTSILLYLSLIVRTLASAPR